MILQYKKEMEATIVALEGRMDAITSSDYEKKDEWPDCFSYCSGNSQSQENP
jgi:hypothetical protein